MIFCVASCTSYTKQVSTICNVVSIAHNVYQLFCSKKVMPKPNTHLPHQAHHQQSHGTSQCLILELSSCCTTNIFQSKIRTFRLIHHGAQCDQGDDADPEKVFIVHTAPPTRLNDFPTVASNSVGQGIQARLRSLLSICFKDLGFTHISCVMPFAFARFR